MSEHAAAAQSTPPALCDRCRSRLANKREQKWRREIDERAGRLPPTIVGSVPIRGSRLITIELVPTPRRTDVRLQFTIRRRSGALEATPLCVTFPDTVLGEIIDRLVDVQRMLAKAAPIAGAEVTTSQELGQ